MEPYGRHCVCIVLSGQNHPHLGHQVSKFPTAAFRLGISSKGVEISVHGASALKESAVSCDAVMQYLISKHSYEQDQDSAPIDRDSARHRCECHIVELAGHLHAGFRRR